MAWGKAGLVTPYVIMGKIYAATALTVINGGDPFIIRFKLLIWFAIFIAALT